MLFKCKHPAAMLRVRKNETTERIDADFERVTYHLWCSKCGERVEVKYERTIGGVDAFLQRRDNDVEPTEE